MSDRLADEAAIRDLMDRYGAAVDERDWAGFAALFTDPLATDFSGIDAAFGPATVACADHVAGTRAVLEHFDATQHMITNVRVVLDGDHARCRAVMRAEHWLAGLRGPPRYTMFGVYENAFVREADGWRIARLALRLTREEGNLDVWTTALRRAGGNG
jgi:ketosteroid isomerase-like protein